MWWEGPAQVVIRAVARVVAIGKDPALQPGGLALLQGLQLVQSPDEQQVGNLLDDLERVGDPAGPEAVPDLVDLVADIACEHRC